RLVFVGETHNLEWNAKILDALHPVCDYLSIHHYSNEAGMGLYGCFATLRRFADSLAELIPLVKGFSQRKEPFNKWYRFPPREDDIKLCLDEWNLWSSANKGSDNRYGVKVVYNWRDALWTSCMMNLMIRNAKDIAIANLAQLVNVLAPILAEKDRSYVQTIFHVLKLYRDHGQGKAVACGQDAPPFDAGPAGRLPAVDSAACLQEDGSLCLFLTNITQDTQYPVRLPEGYAILESVALCAPAFEASNALDREVVEAVYGKRTDGFILKPGTVAMLRLGAPCAV
ncbi:MAG TPA: alpha-L-arabinofuranosidase C-terminal domain-containing protein, partial [Clostridia bacterium]|nr:alpha-L-arabinofuranosidase C-terminal domain-containing protein [Clostridia bacterium]